MAVEKLRELLTEHRSELPEYSWPFEPDRWAELVVCLLHQVCPSAPLPSIREAVSVLQGMDALQIEYLAGLSASAADYAALTWVMRRYDVQKNESSMALDCVISAARAIQEHYGGHVQACIRKHALAARDELVDALSEVDLTRELISFALTHWMQNAYGAPISLEHRGVTTFCRDNNIGMVDLYAASDSIGINAAVVDDLLDIVTKRAKAEAL